MSVPVYIKMHVLRVFVCFMRGVYKYASLFACEFVCVFAPACKAYVLHMLAKVIDLVFSRK